MLGEDTISNQDAIKTGGAAAAEVIADERFAKAVEMLGNSAAQVRVGAMHAINSRGYRLDDDGHSTTTRHELWPVERFEAAELELRVRLTAQRIIVTLLPPADDDAAPLYNLALTRAPLEYFGLKGRKVGVFHRRAWLSGLHARATS